MASVSELVEDIAEVMKEPPETVNAYARALIDSGDLPKSRGRAIAQVEVEHIVKLFMAVALSPKIKDTASTVDTYFNMSKPGVNAEFGDKITGRAGVEICDLVRIILSGPETDEEKEFRTRFVQARISFTINWPEIEIIFLNDGLIRFKDGGSPSHWDGYFKRVVTLSGHAFMLLGFGKGRDYRELSN